MSTVTTTETLPHSDLRYHTEPPSRSEIITLVSDYYAEDPRRRGINGPVGCSYHAPARGEDPNELGDTYCAVGVFIEDTDEIEDADLGNSVWNWKGDLEALLLDPYKGHPIRFWNDLQVFHDNKIHFHPVSGLTEEGERMVKELHATWD